MKPKFFAIGLCVILFGCKSKESVFLKLKYDKKNNDAFVIAVKLKCSSENYIDLETHAHLTLDSAVNNSRYFLTAKVDAIRNDVEFGGLFPMTRSLHYDSQKSYGEMSNEERQVDDQLDALKLNYYHVTMDQWGNVATPFTVIGKPADPPFGMGLVQIPFPDKKVKVGDTWTRSLQNPMKTSLARLMSSDYTFIYTINDIKPDQVLIDVEMKVSSRGMYKTQATGFDAKGSYTVDRNTGQTISGYVRMPLGDCGDALISVVKEAEAN